MSLGAEPRREGVLDPTGDEDGPSYVVGLRLVDLGVDTTYAYFVFHDRCGMLLGKDARRFSARPGHGAILRGKP